MRKIVQYVVVGGVSNWEDEVNELLEKGWQPYGNLVALGSSYPSTSLYQAMVLYEEEGKFVAQG